MDISYPDSAKFVLENGIVTFQYTTVGGGVSRYQIPEKVIEDFPKGIDIPLELGVYRKNGKQYIYLSVNESIVDVKLVDDPVTTKPISSL